MRLDETTWLGQLTAKIEHARKKRSKVLDARGLKAPAALGLDA
jgi:hypothetical protein